MDKSKWPRGEWDREPDKLEWVDQSTNLPCRIFRTEGGHLCGYVGVFPGHPFYGKDDSDSEVYELEVHGGVTYGSRDPRHNIWWLGFDCAHAGDRSPYHGSLRRGTYRNLKYVKAQVTNLARQLAPAHEEVLYGP